MWFFLHCQQCFLLERIKRDKEIVTENLKIVDEKGNTRIELSGNGEGAPVITFYDSKEEGRLTIAVSDDEPGIALCDSEEKGRLAMAVFKDGTPKLDLCDSAEKVRLGMTVSEDEPVIGFLDSEEEMRLGMAVFEDGAPSLELYGPDGEVISSLP